MRNKTRAIESEKSIKNAEHRPQRLFLFKRFTISTFVFILPKNNVILIVELISG